MPEIRPIYGIKQRSTEVLTYLYTKGRLFSLNEVEYIGPYHIHGGAPYTEGEHTMDSQILRPFYTNKSKYDYDFKTLPKSYPVFSKPTYFTTILKEVDYEVGYYTRYFAQKIVNQDAIVYELSESHYKEFGTISGLNDGLYGRVIVNWKLTGPLRSQTVTNTLPSGYVIETEIEGIIDYNQKQIVLANVVLPGLQSTILNYAEFARPTNFNTQFPINTAQIDPAKIIRDKVPDSVKKVFIKALKGRK